MDYGFIYVFNEMAAIRWNTRIKDQPYKAGERTNKLGEEHS